MYEHLAALFGGPPNEFHYSLYSLWSRYDWGMIFTGNVQVSDRHLSLGRDVVVPKKLTAKTIQPFKWWARAIHGDKDDATPRPLAIMQLNHSGRQSGNVLGGRLPFSPPLAPSAIPVGSHKAFEEGCVSAIFHRILFQTPQMMVLADIEEVVSSFVRGAILAAESGFDGVELHVAHGCEFATISDELRSSENNGSYSRSFGAVRLS